MLNVAYRTVHDTRGSFAVADMEELRAILSILDRSKDIKSFKIWGEDGVITESGRKYLGLSYPKAVDVLFLKPEGAH